MEKFFLTLNRPVIDSGHEDLRYTLDTPRRVRKRAKGRTDVMEGGYQRHPWSKTDQDREVLRVKGVLSRVNLVTSTLTEK